MLPQPMHGSARLNLHMCTPQVRQVDGGASRDALAEKYGNAPSEAAIRSMLSNEPCKQHVSEREECMHDAHLLACSNAACMMASMSHVHDRMSMHTIGCVRYAGRGSTGVRLWRVSSMAARNNASQWPGKLRRHAGAPQLKRSVYLS